MIAVGVILSCALFWFVFRHKYYRGRKLILWPLTILIALPWFFVKLILEVGAESGSEIFIMIMTIVALASFVLCMIISLVQYFWRGLFIGIIRFFFAVYLGIIGGMFSILIIGILGFAIYGMITSDPDPDSSATIYYDGITYLQRDGGTLSNKYVDLSTGKVFRKTISGGFRDENGITYYSTD